ncbi:MAG: hypothetical protein AMXMBFR20_26640 [Planctomycetia bacterium]
MCVAYALGLRALRRAHDNSARQAGQRWVRVAERQGGACQLQTSQAGRLRKDFAGEGRLMVVEEEALNAAKEALGFV